MAEFPVVEKCYDLVVWIHGRTARFPRHLRGGIGLRVETQVLDLYEALGAAAVTRQRAGLLRDASAHLNALRRSLRVCLGLRLIAPRQFGFAAERMDEIGRMLGGWLRKESAGPGAGASGSPPTRRGSGEAAPGPV